MSKYIMAVLGLILMYLVLSKSGEFNTIISSLGNLSIKGAGLLQGRSASDIPK